MNIRVEIYIFRLLEKKISVSMRLCPYLNLWNDDSLWLFQEFLKLRETNYKFLWDYIEPYIECRISNNFILFPEKFFLSDRLVLLSKVSTCIYVQLTTFTNLVLFEYWVDYSINLRYTSWPNASSVLSILKLWNQKYYWYKLKINFRANGKCYSILAF